MKLILTFGCLLYFLLTTPAPSWLFSSLMGSVLELSCFDSSEMSFNGRETLGAIPRTFAMRRWSFYMDISHCVLLSGEEQGLTRR